MMMIKTFNGYCTRFVITFHGGWGGGGGGFLMCKGRGGSLLKGDQTESGRG